MLRQNRKTLLELSRLVVEARDRSGLTQFEFARKARLHQTTISKMEWGNYEPTITQLEHIAKAGGGELVLPKIKFK